MGLYSCRIKQLRDDNFNEIKFKLNLKKYKDINFYDLERGDIYNFIKVS